MKDKTSLLWRSFYLTGNSLLVLAVSACGGGGGGGGGDSTGGGSGSNDSGGGNSNVSTPSGPLTRNNYNQHLFITHSAEAQQSGLTGAGVIIGLIDSGVLTTNLALSGKVINSLSYVDSTTNNINIGDVRGHGTMVAETIAGQRVGNFSGGVAPGVSIVSARIISDTPTSAGSPRYSLARVNMDVANSGAKIINNSWSLPDWDINDRAVTNNYVNAYQYFISTHGGLVVFSSGNDSASTPNKIASLPSVAGSLSLEKGWLVVSAVNTYNPNELASYANACGISMRYCMVAPGTVSVLSDDGVNNTMVSGTSFAAPQVSGAAALVWQAFPYFSNDLVRQTLLGTATDLGAPGVDSTFGYGLLNTAAAIRGPMKFDWGDVSVSFDGYSSTWRNPISGAGGLIKQGSGTLILAEDATYSGLTQVQGGTLSSSNSLASAVNIGTQGTLDVRRVGGQVNNQGSVVLRNGQTVFNRDYVQTKDGQLDVVLGSTLQIAGAANIQGGNLNVLAIPQGYITVAKQDVLTANKGVTGSFDKLTQSAGVFLDATIGQSSNDVWLNVNRINTSSVQGVEYTAAATAGANRVEKAFTQLDQQAANSPTASANSAQSDFLNAAASLQQSPTAQAAKASLESLSGQMPAASTAMTYQAINVNNRQVSNHIAQLLDSPKTNEWSNNINYQSSMTSGGYSGLGYNMNGWVMGQDVFLDRNTFIGSTLSRSSTSGSLRGGSEQSNGTITEGSLYGGKIFDAYYVTGRIGSGYYDGQQKRNIQLGNQSFRADSDQGGSYFTAGSEIGYRIKKDGWQFTPYVDTQYISLKQDAFTESGASGFGLKANDQTTTRWQAGVGARTGYGWDVGHKQKLVLTASTHYQHAIAQDDGSYNASFTGVNQYMPLDGIALSRDVVMIGSGLEWMFSEALSMNMNYEQYFSDNQQSSSLNMNVSVRF
ncbi:S8 family serine peptidase [Budvicia aquatica]|uniref:S8 family serine peptidase n=1 Tax=Budvicia aquatica TaxID=82979 RepID=UPI00207E3BD8|nr:S8 family serine peptidase [Budvicia aquatica]GKX53305.1 serine protease [Budvicia aquatica]